MKPYFVKTPKVFRWFYPNRIWINKFSNRPLLTFDDGPIPEVTPWVLDILKQYEEKAIFFCIGDNIHKYPDIFKRIIDEGHIVGNHTYHHLNGYKTNTNNYINNVLIAEEEISKHLINVPRNKLFRPPYGKLTRKQEKILRNEGFEIVMWNLLSGDFDKSISKEKCLQQLIYNLDKTSLIVFHDSLKAERRLRYVLPKVLQLINEK